MQWSSWARQRAVSSKVCDRQLKGDESLVQEYPSSLWGWAGFWFHFCRRMSLHRLISWLWDGGALTAVIFQYVAKACRHILVRVRYNSNIDSKCVVLLKTEIRLFKRRRVRVQRMSRCDAKPWMPSYYWSLAGVFNETVWTGGKLGSAIPLVLVEHLNKWCHSLLAGSESRYPTFLLRLPGADDQSCCTWASCSFSYEVQWKVLYHSTAVAARSFAFHHRFLFNCGKLVLHSKPSRDHKYH
jgi:hypothetical protein